MNILSTLLTALLVFFAFNPCCEAGEPDFAPDYSFVMTNRWGMGHGCNVNGYSLTNAHMVDPRAPEDILQPLPPMTFRYEMPGIHAGLAYSIGVVSRGSIDIALLRLSGRVPSYGVVGPEPLKGERIRWVEYDWRKNEDWMAPRGRHARVTRTRAGIIILDGGVTEGASGGCAYNDAGEIVGLMTFWSEGWEDEEKVGGVLGFYGGWWNTLGLPRVSR